jgi:hypothetical protein
MFQIFSSALSGAGTSMLVPQLTTLLPAMTLAEVLDPTHIPHGAGLTGRGFPS